MRHAADVHMQICRRAPEESARWSSISRPGPNGHRPISAEPATTSLRTAGSPWRAPFPSLISASSGGFAVVKRVNQVLGKPLFLGTIPSDRLGRAGLPPPEVMRFDRLSPVKDNARHAEWAGDPIHAEHPDGADWQHPATAVADSGDRGESQDPALDALYDAAVRDTIAQFEATGSPVITDGEQRKYHNFWTYCVQGLPTPLLTVSRFPSRRAIPGACFASPAARSAITPTRTATSRWPSDTRIGRSNRP